MVKKKLSTSQTQPNLDRIEKLHSVLGLTALAVSLAALFILGLYERLLRLLQFGWFLAAYDPYIRYYLAELLVKDGIAHGILWWISGGLAKYLSHSAIENFRIVVHEGYTYFTQFWYPYFVDWAKVLSPGTSLLGAVFFELFKGVFGNDLYKAVIVCPCVFNALTVFSIAYFAWRLCSNRELRKWCALLAAVWAGLSILFVQRSLSGWFDDVPFFQFFAPLGMALFLESYYRRGLLRVLFLVLSALVNGFTVWIWGAYVYLWNIYGLIAVIVSLYVLLREKPDVVDPRRFFLSYLAVYIGFLSFILVTPRYALHTLLSGMSLMPHVGLVATIVTLLAYTALRPRFAIVKKVVVIASVVVAFSLFTGFVLTVTGVLPLKAFKIGGRFLAIVAPLLRSPLVQSVAEHSYMSPGYVYTTTRLVVLAIVPSIVASIIQPSLASILLLTSTVFAAYFTSSMTYVLMLAAVIFVPAAVYSVDIMARLRSRVVAAVLVLAVCILVSVSAIITAQVGATAAKSIYPTIVPGGLNDWVYSLEWLKYKTALNATVLSWWDYGYLTTVIGNRTSLADNSTINTTQIATIARFFLTNVTDLKKIYKVLRDLGFPKYVLVYGPYLVYEYSPAPIVRYCVGIPLPLGDFPKSYWMARIAGYNDTYIYSHFLCAFRVKKVRIGTTIYQEQVPNLVMLGKTVTRIVVPWSLNYTLYNLLFNQLVLLESPQCAGSPIWVFERGTVLVSSGKALQVYEKLPFYEGHLVQPAPHPPSWIQLVYEPYGKDVAGWVMIYRINYTNLVALLKNRTKIEG